MDEVRLKDELMARLSNELDRLSVARLASITKKEKKFIKEKQ